MLRRFHSKYCTLREQESKNDDGQRQWHVTWHVAPAGTVIGLVNATVLGIVTNREHFPKRVEPRSSDPMFFLEFISVYREIYA